MLLEIPALIFDDMVQHALAESPAECCGILAGAHSVITRRFGLRNELASPVRYNADARDLFAAFREMRQTGLEVSAIYHSHPAAPAWPSLVDLVQNYYCETPRIIISLAGAAPVVKAFLLFEDRFEELPCIRKPN